MLKVGITGGIGSGKTFVSRIFESLGVPVYYSDDRAKWLMQHHPDLKNKLIALLGEASYKGDILDRSYIASKVFKHPALLRQLNQLVHPCVREDFNAFCARQTNAPYVLNEAALLVESGSYKDLDLLIVVTCSLQKRIERVIARDNVSREQVLERIKNQLSEEEKISLADFIIINNDDTSPEKQVSEIHRIILSKNSA
jgi:dephospho-CoA kinase